MYTNHSLAERQPWKWCRREWHHDSQCCLKRNNSILFIYNIFKYIYLYIILLYNFMDIFVAKNTMAQTTKW